MDTFQDLLVQYSNRLNYGPKRMAERSGISEDTIKNWLDGTTKKPRQASEVLKICFALNLNRTETVNLLQSAGQDSIRERLDALISELQQTFKSEIEKKARAEEFQEQLSRWSKDILIEETLNQKVKLALSTPDYIQQLHKLADEYPRKEIRQVLQTITFNITEDSSVRINALDELVTQNAIGNDQWITLLQYPKTTFITAMIDFLTNRKNIVLSKEQVNTLLTNTALPRRTSGLGQLIVEFIERGSNCTSAIFLPLKNHVYWGIRYDCVRSIIKLDDDDSLTTLDAFMVKTTYSKARYRTANYLLSRFNAGRLSSIDKEIAIRILNRIMTDGETREESAEMNAAKESFNVIELGAKLPNVKQQQVIKLIEEAYQLVLSNPSIGTSEWRESIANLVKSAKNNFNMD